MGDETVVSAVHRLIIVCGLPGAGKTTHGKHLAAELGAVRFSPDEWMSVLGLDLYDEAARTRVEALQWDLAQDVLRLGRNAIIEWGTWSRSERDVLREGGRALGALVELHYLDAPVDVLWERVSDRGAESPPISKTDLEEWARMFEIPTTEEMSLYDDSTQVASSRSH